MIRLREVSVDYGHGPLWPDISLEIPSGSLTLLAGNTGCGKSSLLGAIAGLIPDFSGGRLNGRIETSSADGQPARVALVQQSPSAGFVGHDVTSEIQFGLEHLPQSTQRLRVEAALAAVGIEALADRGLDELSLGESARVAIAAALAQEPDVLLIDEPTSALDPVAADEVLGLLRRLASDFGITVLVSEHRYEQVVQQADHLLLLSAAGVQFGEIDLLVGKLPLPPITVQIAQAASLGRLPLSISALRKLAPVTEAEVPGVGSKPAEVVARLEDVRVQRGDQLALAGANLEFRAGEFCAVLGRNGAGKSTLLHTLFGDWRPNRGRVQLMQQDPARLDGAALINLVSIVPQQPIDLLIDESVQLALDANDERRQLSPGSSAAVLAQLAAEIQLQLHPRQLSVGQQLLTALSMAIANPPKLLLLDEPTRGIDPQTRQKLLVALKELKAGGTAIVCATHDLDWAAEIADRAVLLAGGEVVANGNAREVLTSSRLMAPTVTRALWPTALVTVEEAIAAFRKSKA